MKKALLSVMFSAASVLCITPAYADLALATAKNCMNCHNVDKKVLGPSYKEVANKYRGDKTALDRLTAKVMKGGSGTWGVVSMPANPQVSEAEARKLVAWVLSSK